MTDDAAAEDEVPGANRLPACVTPLETVEDFLQEARARLPEAMWNQLCGDYGAEAWRTMSNNIDGFKALKLKPRVMVDVSTRCLRTSVLGCEIALPVMIAPSGSHQRWHVDGELATAKAAARAGTIMALSSASTFSIEEVAATSTGPRWFQAYVFRDRRVTARLIERAERAGYAAVVVTVDMPGTDSPEREVSFPRYNFGREFDYVPTIDPSRLLRNLEGMEATGLELPTHRALNQYFDTRFTWSDLAWIRELTSLPIVIKGIQTAEDARLCRECGVEGIVVSNHGGFALRNARATIDALPEVVAEAGSLEVYLDGGVRCGTDVLTALALGATSVFIGRAHIWGLTVGGEDGVVDVLELLRYELDQAMRYCGLTDVGDADERLLVTGSSCAAKAGDDLLSRLSKAGILNGSQLQAARRVLARP